MGVLLRGDDGRVTWRRLFRGLSTLIKACLQEKLTAGSCRVNTAPLDSLSSKSLLTAFRRMAKNTLVTLVGHGSCRTQVTASTPCFSQEPQSNTCNSTCSTWQTLLEHKEREFSFIHFWLGGFGCILYLYYVFIFYPHLTLLTLQNHSNI